ncbi:hypothetical protein pdam_00016662 [Pocillopora damicornis]|uniref:Uncharacterized protein n=1 Tax=Pocillopora damicornis TaxID=46731 RepID=A0A3M6U8J7_POCDA|nr:hypothetical protein pdam_00016662 [Pocillopora damicornis]
MLKRAMGGTPINLLLSVKFTPPAKDNDLPKMKHDAVEANTRVSIFPPEVSRREAVKVLSCTGCLVPAFRRVEFFSQVFMTDFHSFRRDCFKHHRDRLVTKLQHRSEAPGNKARIMKTNTPPQTLQVGVRKDRISVIFAFLQGPMSVSSGKFSISEQIKFKTLGDPRISSLHFKEGDIEISISVYVLNAIRLSLTQRNLRILLVRVRSVLPIGRDSVMSNRKPRKKLDVEDSIETCVDFSADATSVNHDHSHFCSQEKATPKSNTNGFDTTLPKVLVSLSQKIVAYIWRGELWKYCEFDFNMDAGSGKTPSSVANTFASFIE